VWKLNVEIVVIIATSVKTLQRAVFVAILIIYTLESVLRLALTALLALDVVCTDGDAFLQLQEHQTALVETVRIIVTAVNQLHFAVFVAMRITYTMGFALQVVLVDIMAAGVAVTDAYVKLIRVLSDRTIATAANQVRVVASVGTHITCTTVPV